MSINIIRLVKKEGKFQFHEIRSLSPYHGTIIHPTVQQLCKNVNFPQTMIFLQTQGPCFTQELGQLYINLYHCFIQTQQALGEGGC